MALKLKSFHLTIPRKNIPSHTHPPFPTLTHCGDYIPVSSVGVGVGEMSSVIFCEEVSAEEEIEDVINSMPFSI